MIREPHVLLQFLYKDPHAWPVRMALIEEMVKEGELDKAKELIRESPDDAIMPADYPQRIHSLMTRGADALADLPPLPGFEQRSETSDPEPEPEQTSDISKPEPNPEPEVVPAQKSGEPLQSNAREPRTSKSSLPVEEPLFDYQPVSANVGKDGKVNVHRKAEGGAAALIESAPAMRTRRGPKPKPPTIDQKIASIRWDNYSGKLHLTRGETPESAAAPDQQSDRVSSMTLAVMLHAAIALLISFVVIQTPRPNPPKLVLTVPDENISDDLVVHRLTKPQTLTPSAASRQAVSVETSIAISDLALPEVEDMTNLDVTAMIDGAADLGSGLSVSLDTHSQSDINFFGISSGGKSIVFVIDATRPMLVDEKGGMFAYDKVKNEIASMLVSLNRATKFNILLYEGKRVMAFREDLVPGLPSNIRLAVSWMDPLNRNYDNLGLDGDYGVPIEVADLEKLPIHSRDIAHYTKCIQKAMEWQAASVFCIGSGYRQMGRSLSPEMLEQMRNNPGTPGTVDPADQERWRKAVEKTREWLRKENEARQEKGLAPKVVINFTQLVREVTGETPPRRTGGSPGANINRPPNVSLDEIDEQLKRLVSYYYKQQNKDEPSVHMVLFLGEDEDLNDADKDHFRNIVRKNNGKLKLLRGLSALQDVTGK